MYMYLHQYNNCTTVYFATVYEYPFCSGICRSRGIINAPFCFTYPQVSHFWVCFSQVVNLIWVRFSPILLPSVILSCVLGSSYLIASFTCQIFATRFSCQAVFVCASVYGKHLYVDNKNLTWSVETLLQLHQFWYHFVLSSAVLENLI